MAEINDEMYEELRRILEVKNSKSYTFEDAREIGNELTDFSFLLDLIIKMKSMNQIDSGSAIVKSNLAIQ